MREFKFTPGPWRIETENETGTPTISIRDGLNQQIATVNPYRLAWRDADAALIAAAPEMYEALEKLVNDWMTGSEVITTEMVKSFQQTIAKARGESC